LWTATGGKALQYNEAIKLVNDNKVKYSRDESTQSLTARFNDGVGENEIWFEDAKSIYEKSEAVRKFGVYKISLWHLGGEDAQIWDIIKDTNI
jgi:spore germination protein